MLPPLQVVTSSQPSSTDADKPSKKGKKGKKSFSKSPDKEISPEERQYQLDLLRKSVADAGNVQTEIDELRRGCEGRKLQLILIDGQQQALDRLKEQLGRQVGIFFSFKGIYFYHFKVRDKGVVVNPCRVFFHFVS